MARHTGQRSVQCYHCQHRFDVAGRAESVSCPGCNKPLIVGDMVVKKLMGPVKQVRTCGKIEVAKKGRILAELIEAHAGLDVQGAIEAQRVISKATVILGPKCQFKGDLQAPALEIKSGAKITRGNFAIPMPSSDSG